MRNDELMHHGIYGQKWGIRRYQNADGSLTEAGKIRYRTSDSSVDSINDAKGMSRRLNDVDKSLARNSESLRKVNHKLRTGDYNWRYENKLTKKASDIQFRMDSGQNEIKSILKRAEDKGFDTSDHYTRRLVSSGAEIIAKSILYTGVANAITMPTIGRPAVIASWRTVPGRKYNVKEKR